ncbi:hypothetical protein ACOKFD_11580 [Flagellimonas sp. S174]|uniref:hypothetical protein n=1 Tax=Flagellimonas sp. S174 TaxID=3410790 RepID=UPI003BF46A88
MNRIFDQSKIELLFYLATSMLFISCSNDDDNGPTQNPEPEIAVVAPEGEVVFTNTNSLRTRKVTLNLSDGALVEDSTLDEPQNLLEHQGSVYVIKKGAISRQESSGVNTWERLYPETDFNEFLLLDANFAFGTDALFIQYTQRDLITFESRYFLEALELSTGITRWIEELSLDVESFPFIIGNRLLLTPRNSFDPIRYYNLQTGVVEADNSYTDRVDPGRFVDVNGTIIASSWNNRILALDANLDIAWTFDTRETNAIKGILFDEQFIFPSRDETLYSLNQSSGDLNWETPLPNRLTLGLHESQGQIYLFQPKIDAPPELLTINPENGMITDTFSIDTGTTSIDDIRAAFFQEFMIVMSSINDTENTVQLIHLPTAETVWEITADNTGFGTTIKVNSN